MISLTDKQTLVWRLWRRGLSISKIATKLGISRQAVHKNLKTAKIKIYKALISTAKAAKINVKEIDVDKGFLMGWNPGLKVKVYVTFSPRNGVQVWFEHKRDCKKCPFHDECLKILLTEAEEREIPLPNADKLEPSQLAEVFFKELMGK